MTLINSSKPRLTPRETEILQMMAAGQPRGEIATRLGISILTVKTHIQNVKIRFDSSSTYQIVAVAVSNGLISL